MVHEWRRLLDKETCNTAASIEDSSVALKKRNNTGFRNKLKKLKFWEKREKWKTAT
jgi:hypothetical protein